MQPPTNRPLYHYYPSRPPLDANFDTKLASGFLCFWPCYDAEIKSSKVGKGQKLHYRVGRASFQEIERFSTVPRMPLQKLVFVRFLLSKCQNATTVDDWSVIVQGGV